MERDEALNQIVPANQILKLEDIKKIFSASWALELFYSITEKRKKLSFPWDGISNSIIYTIRDSDELEVYCAPSGKYNVIVITKGMLIYFERACGILAMLNYYFDKQKSNTLGNDELISMKECGKFLTHLSNNRIDPSDIDSRIDKLIEPLSQCDYIARWGGAFLQILILFVIEHEYAHVTNGHLELPNVIDANKQKILSKPMWSGKGNLLRTCEISADIRALESTLSMSYREISKSIKTSKESETESWRRLIGSSSIPITFLLNLKTLYPTQRSLIRWSDHPPGNYRLFAIWQYLQYWVNSEFQNFDSAEIDLIKNDWILTSTEFQTKTGMCLYKVSKDGSIMMPPIEELEDYYIEHSFGLNRWPDLEKLCLIGLVERVYDSSAAKKFAKEWPFS